MVTLQERTTLRDQERATALTNSDLIKHVLAALYRTASRRTSSAFAVMIMNDILKTLRQKYEYEFLEDVVVQSSEYVDTENVVLISSDLNKIDPLLIGKAIESIVRVVNTNLKDVKAGLYFITELKNQMDSCYMSEIKKFGVDLDLIQIEQHYLYSQEKMKESVPKSYRELESQRKNRDSYINILRSNLENIAFWRYENNICTLYNKKGEVLDRLPLDKIVKEYIVKVKGFEKPSSPSNPTDKLVEINEKEYEFLRLLHSRDMDVETAVALLHISKDGLNTIIKKLLANEVLQYISWDEVSLTDAAITLLKEREPKTKK